MRDSWNTTLVSALLARAPLWSADLFTVTLLNGAVYHWTTADRDVTFDGVTWSATGPALERTSWSVKNTTEVPELAITLYPTGTFPLGNILALIHNGLFDGAYIELSRAFMPQFGDTSLGTVTLFGGRVGKIDIDSISAKITCTASNVILAQYMPRNTYQRGCIHTLYDAGCTLSKAAHTTKWTVHWAMANGLIQYAETPPADPSVHVLGTMTVISGAGAGQTRTVIATDAGTIICAYPLYIVPAVDDQFTLAEGCNKTIARCIQFGNTNNIRAFPYIPPSTTGL